MTTTLPAWLQRAKGHAADLLFPARCLSCGSDILMHGGYPDSSDVNLCAPCKDSLTVSGRSQQAEIVCQQCAARIPAIQGIECPHCNRNKYCFDRAMALGSYEGRLRQLVLRMKQDRTETIAQTLGQLLCQRLTLLPNSELWDLVMPIPMHPWRQFIRGTNGPAILARIVGSYLGIPILGRALRVSHNSIPQKGLSRKLRFRNMRDGMVLQAGYPIEAAKVLLVDDILTTGATCSEAARILKQAGAAHVTVAVIGRTVG